MGLTPQQVSKQEASASQESYPYRALVAFNQFVNVLTGGLPGETISARSQRAASKGHWLGKAMCWWLDKIQSKHGYKAVAGDLARAEKVEETEERELGVKEEDTSRGNQ